MRNAVYAKCPTHCRKDWRACHSAGICLGEGELLTAPGTVLLVDPAPLHARIAALETHLHWIVATERAANPAVQLAVIVRETKKVLKSDA